MDWHPTEDDLVLHYYGESTDEARAAIEGHVRTCSVCAGAWRELSDTLALVSTAVPPEPGEGFERVMWARVSQALPPQRVAWSWRARVLTCGLAAALVAAIATGYTWVAVEAPDGESSAATSPAADADMVDTRERVLLTALNDHFSQTEILLVELLNAPSSGTTAMEFRRTTADDLVVSGRLYRQTARQTGDLQFANMLEDLEGVLVEVAAAPAAVDRRDFDFLRTRIEDDALLFKVRAVSTEIRDRQHQLMTP